MKIAKILMLTAGLEVQARQRAQKAGADGFLSKSAKPTDILKAVHRLLKNEEQETYAKF